MHNINYGTYNSGANSNIRIEIAVQRQSMPYILVDCSCRLPSTGKPGTCLHPVITCWMFVITSINVWLVLDGGHRFNFNEKFIRTTIGKVAKWGITFSVVFFEYFTDSFSCYLKKLKKCNNIKKHKKFFDFHDYYTFSRAEESTRLRLPAEIRTFLIAIEIFFF